ncbi:MAG: sigma-70 family RNA polymerase sigma factor [Clostridia bacterium]|nr:sigma-70 family RNA polymerase sigma factor [Clostridia bacterium]
MARFIEKKKCRVDEYLLKIRQGDSSVLGLLYEETAKQLYTLCYTYLRNRQNSEDALSETYLTTVRNIDKYRGSKGFNWLYTICKNTCLNMLRKNEKNVFVDFDDEETVNVLGLKEENTPDLADESGIIALSKQVLKENEFQVVVLHAVNAMKFKEIAKIVGEKESTVRWQYNNAIKKVKNAYERRMRDDG